MTKKRFVKGLKKRLLLLGWLALLALLIGQLGEWHWLLELFSHFTPYYIIFIFLGCLGASKGWVRTFFILTTLAGVLWLSTPLSNRFWQPHEYSLTPSLNIVSYNLWISNPEKAAEIKRLEEQKPDVLLLTEASSSWAVYLYPLEEKFEHCQHYEDSPFGIALFSKLPMLECEVLYLDSSPTTPYIRAVLHNGITIYGIHPPPPINAELAQERNAMLEALAIKIRAEKK